MPTEVQSVGSIIGIGQVSTYLAAKGEYKKKFFNPAQLISHPLKTILAMETDSVAWANAYDPTDDTLRLTANYLYELCGGYNLEAIYILTGSTPGTVVNVVESSGLLLQPFRMQFIVNSPTFPSGGTSITLGFRCFGTASDDLEVILQNAPMNALDADTVGDFTYAVTFNLSTTVITFQQNGTLTAPADDQVMVISGFKYVTSA